MKPARQSRSGGVESRHSVTQVDTRHEKTPETDLQGEDAGTPASGNSGNSGNSARTSAQSAMKQTSKTSDETGSKR